MTLTRPTSRGHTAATHHAMYISYAVQQQEHTAVVFTRELAIFVAARSTENELALNICAVHVPTVHFLNPVKWLAG